MKEVELKFLVERDVGRKVWDRAIELGLFDVEPPVRELESIYYDSAGNKLRKAGMSLRLRRTDGAWLQTVKYDRQLNGGLSRSGEFEVEVPQKAIQLDAIDDRKLRKRIENCIGDEAIEPVCWTLVNRRADKLTFDDGSVAELALDIGLISAGIRSVDFCEIEIELISGQAGTLYSLASRLFPEGGLRFSRYSKSQRGFMLAEKGVIDPVPKPRRAKQVALNKDEPVHTALRDTLRECIDQISRNIEVIAAGDCPDGPHQMRIGLRRLRVLFSLFSKMLEPAHVSQLAVDSRWLFSGAGRLRDIDSAIADHIRPLMDDNPGEPGFQRLISALEREAADRRANLRAMLKEFRTQDLLLRLSLLAETLGEDRSENAETAELFDQPLSCFAGNGLHRLWKKARKHGSDLSTMETAQRHQLRKDLKKLRYTAEFFGPIFYRGDVKSFLRQLKDIQSVLGDVVDVSSVPILFQQARLFDNPDPELQRAIGWVLGSGKVKAQMGWDQAQQHWSVLGETKPFWR